MINCFCTKECDFANVIYEYRNNANTYVVFTVYYALIDLQSQLSSDPLKRRSALSQIDVGLDFFYIFTFEHYHSDLII
jgi:hypothetical protein